MYRIFRLCLVVAGVTLPVLLSAAERPEPAEVRKVIDYYLKGAEGGVVLTEAFLCKKVEVGAETGSDCAGRLEGPVETGREAYLWMNYLVPVGPPADLLVTFSREGKVRSVVPFHPKPSIHYRTWTRIPTGVPGTWRVEVVQELGGRDLLLLDMVYEVTGEKRP